jgi:hypothetical protein
MVWTRIYENSKDLWSEGNFLRIEGKVKVKDERLQLTCDAVESVNRKFSRKQPRLFLV